DIPTDQISTQHNFFTHGGNSLRAIQLISRIHDTLGHHIDLRQVYLDATISGIAAAIDRQPVPAAAQPRQELLVPLRANGSRPPLFCVHPVGGSAAPYLALTGLLPADLPVYGFEAAGLHGGEPLRAVPEMAERYLPELLARQPRGPYHLLGWSAGGLIALELAARLRERGEPVALLTLLDTVAPRPDDPLPNHAELLAHFAHDVAAQAGVPAPALELHGLPENERAAAVTKALERAGLVPAGIERELRARMDVFIATSLAARTYRLPTIHSGATLLTARERRDGRTPRWPAHASRIEVPGNHYTVLREPHVTALAAIVTDLLDS
ncbi:non-ribosomal peptide synthetase, partial [Phytohabitans aurantiacus]|uniref:non-ribosomal peptide synthetase n=1 Tax=Phytohabitans aurantiacus TaxID=3016789 RepID=UPI00248FDDC7